MTNNADIIERILTVREHLRQRRIEPKVLYLGEFETTELLKILNTSYSIIGVPPRPPIPTDLNGALYYGMEIILVNKDRWLAVSESGKEEMERTNE